MKERCMSEATYQQLAANMLMNYAKDHPLDKLCQEYFYQKLSKSDNGFSSYSKKCWDTFLRHRVEHFV